MTYGNKQIRLLLLLLTCLIAGPPKWRQHWCVASFAPSPLGGRHHFHDGARGHLGHDATNTGRISGATACARRRRDVTRYRSYGAHPSPQSKRHLDRLSRFCKAESCVQQTDHATTVATGRIFAL